MNLRYVFFCALVLWVLGNGAVSEAQQVDSTQIKESKNKQTVAYQFDAKNSRLSVINRTDRELKNYLVSVLVSEKDLPFEFSKFGWSWVYKIGQTEQMVPVQIGQRWLTDPESVSAVRLTSILPSVPRGVTLNLQLQKEPTVRNDIFHFAGKERQRELLFKGSTVLKLMGREYRREPKADREKTYKVFHHVGYPGFKGFLTKGAGGLFSHHRGIFYGFNQIRYSDSKQKHHVDTWHASGAFQRLEKVLLEEIGPVFGRQVVEIQWVNEKKNPVEVFATETRQITVFKQGDHYAFDLASSLETLEYVIDLKGDPQHAGFQFRASQDVAAKTKAETYYLRPDGIGQKKVYRNWPKNADHINLPYHGMHFELRGEPFAVLRLDRDANPRPSRFSERDYGRFGCYFEHVLRPGQPLDINYRLLIKNGKFDLPSAKSWHRQFQYSSTAENLTTENGSRDRLSGNGQSGSQNRTWNSVGWDLDIDEQSGVIVFQGGKNKKDWDSAIRERGWIQREGRSWQLFYTGYDGTRSGVKRLGVATSNDGLVWRRSPKPVLDGLWVEDMHVVSVPGGDRWAGQWMFAEGEKDQAHLLKRNEKGKWESVGVLDIRMTNGKQIPAGPRGTPTAFYHKGQWWLFYERRDQGIWLAKCDSSVPNGKVDHSQLLRWVNVSDDPVIGLGSASFNSQMIALNQIVPVDGGFVAMMHATGSKTKPRKWCCTCAFSEDLLNWQHRPTPLTDPSHNRSSGLLLKDGRKWLFYTTHGTVERFRVKVFQKN